MKNEDIIKMVAEFEESEQKYYEKHFANKSPDEFLGEISYDALFALGNTFARMQIILACLYRITEDSSYFNSLKSEVQVQINDTILGVHEISNCLKEIIEPILSAI